VFAADRVEIASIDKDVYRNDQRGPAAPAVKESYEYYEIRGNSEAQMRSEMCRTVVSGRTGKPTIP